MLTCSLAAFASCDIDLDTPVESFSVEKDMLSVGIISDSQLRYKKSDSENLYQNDLIRALSVLKERDVDMILFGGDITDESDGKEQLYFSDFYNAIDGMSDTVKLKLDKKGSGLSVKIYAVDSWGAVSENYTLITDISI